MLKEGVVDVKRKYCVYIHTNIMNNKVYVGQTIESTNPANRWNKGFGYTKSPLFWQAIQEFGWNNFTHEVLKTDLTKEEADYWERYYIKQYNSTNNEFGYNIKKGGQPLRTLSIDEEINIINTYLECQNASQTSSITQHNNRTVSRVLKTNGFDFYTVDKEKIIELYKQHNSEIKVHELTGYSCTTIRKVLVENGIDTKYINHEFDIDKNDVIQMIDLYENGNRIEDIVNKFKSKYDFITNYFVLKILKNNNINTSKFLKRRLNKEEVTKKYNETKSIKETAKFFGVGRESLTYYMIENNIELNSKNVQTRVKCIFKDQEVIFDSLMDCAKYLIDNNIVNNKCVRGLRDSLSTAMKNNTSYKNIKIERIESYVKNKKESR